MKLTPRELQVATLMSESGIGMNIAEVGQTIGVSERQVKNLLWRLYFKLGLAEDPELHKQIRLAVWWNCELFQIGLRELGIVRNEHADGGPGPGLRWLEATAS